MPASECSKRSGSSDWSNWKPPARKRSVRRAHAAWFLALAEAFDAGGRAGATGALDRIERELPNFRIALSWTDRPDAATTCPGALVHLWCMRSHRTEGRDWLERSLARDPDLTSTERFAALESLGRFEHSLGNPELGTRYMRQALALARERDDRRGIVRCARESGGICGRCRG